MRVHSPFSFVVGQRAYSAGDYLVTSPNLQTYRLTARDGGASAAVMTQSGDSGLQQHEAGLVFANLGAGQYALTQIWVHGGNWGSSGIAFLADDRASSDPGGRSQALIE